MITVVLFYWSDAKSAWRNMYVYDHSYLIKTMRMVDKHLTLEHEFVIATDDVNSVRECGVEKIVKIDPHLYSPGKRFQKLMIWRPDAAELFGEHILMIDLDNMIVDNIDDIVNRDEDVVLWNNPTKQNIRTKYNTSMVLLKAGSRPCVWNEFNMRNVSNIIRNERLSGTDQAWVSRILSGEATWSKEDGVVSFTYDLLRPGVRSIPGSKVVCFNGRIHPSHITVRNKYPELYNLYAGEVL